MVTSIVKSGKPFEDRTAGVVYEAQVGSASEEVSGRIATRGTASTQAKLATFGSPVIGVFDKQQGLGGTSSVSPVTYDDNYIYDAAPVKLVSHGPFTWTANLNDGNVITKGMKMQYETATGKLDEYDASAPFCALALQDVTSSGSDEDLECLFLGNTHCYVEETLTIATDAVTCSYSGIAYVGYVEHIEGDIVYSISHIATGTATDNGVCLFVRSTSVITFEATDMADGQTVRVGYFI